jgi:hypothetical protein
MPDPLDYQMESAHKHSSGHRADIEASEVARCFYCFATFPPSQIAEWVDDGATALCPRCHVDAVIGERSRVDLSDEFFRRMHTYWFER